MCFQAGFPSKILYTVALNRGCFLSAYGANCPARSLVRAADGLAVCHATLIKIHAIQASLWQLCLSRWPD